MDGHGRLWKIWEERAGEEYGRIYELVSIWEKYTRTDEAGSALKTYWRECGECRKQEYRREEGSNAWREYGKTAQVKNKKMGGE